MRRGMMATLSGTLATMGPGVPCAIAAKFAWPDRVAIAFVGDGAMLMNGNNELVTIAESWKSWSDPRLHHFGFGESRSQHGLLGAANHERRP
jgi:pyruvate dehydrogenase (quinone)